MRKLAERYLPIAQDDEGSKEVSESDHNESSTSDPKVTDRPRLVCLSGAGVSAESGIPTFRGADGLWEGHRITDVASPEGWNRNPELVLDFYNQRRKKARSVEPNRGHEVLAELEDHYRVTIVTQNIDNLHERAGSSEVIHLHGEILKARSTHDPSLIYELDNDEIQLGDTCELGYQLRPHIVWFGEAVPMIETAAMICEQADVFVVVGTSLAVYPAAGLVHFAPAHIPMYIIDPAIPDLSGFPSFHPIEEQASTGLEELKRLLLNP